MLNDYTAELEALVPKQTADSLRQETRARQRARKTERERNTVIA